MGELKRISIYVVHDESSDDYDCVLNWLTYWEEKAKVIDYSTGGWEHIWDIEAPIEAVEELPSAWLCSSQWATPEAIKKPNFLMRLLASISNLK